MSNRPNQSDFDDDDFRFDDNDDFDFGDDDDAFGRGLGDDLGGDDLPPLDDDGDDDGGGRGPSRTFIVIAALMIILFIIGLGALGFFFIRGQGPSDAALTATAESGTIIAMNATIIADTTLTAEAALLFAGTQTQEAFDLTLTAQAPTATPTDTPPPTIPTETPTPTLDATDLAAMAFQTQMALTLTAEAQPIIPSETPTSPGISIDSVQQTATRLAELLISPTVDGQGGGVIATPTQEGSFVPLPTRLPDTGLFDDIAAGGANGISMIALAFVGLLAVIFVSRRMRSSINK